jgi:hypothetical protein
VKTNLVVAGAVLVALAIWSDAARSQSGTDIFLAPLEIGEGTIHIGTPGNVTHRPGYDNQPAFLPQGDAFLYTSIRDGQADIYRYDLKSSRSTQITRTPESEYSPTPIPGNTGFAVVQVEADSTQRLWQFTEDGKGSTLLLRDVKPVGYQAWAGPTKVAVFVLGEPHTLVLADTRSGLGVEVARDIGRSLQPVPGGPWISFPQRDEDGSWWIRRVNAGTRRVEPLVPALAGSEDHAWTPDGTLLSAHDNVVYKLRPGDEFTAWSEVARFDDPAMAHLTRLAVSPDGKWIAMVSDEPAP